MLTSPRSIFENPPVKSEVPVLYTFAQTSHGKITWAWTERGLCWLGLEDDTARLANAFKTSPRYAPETQIPQTIDLDLYGTPFQLAVWRALLNIPYGQTSTYMNIACTIEKPTAMRAVGTAIGKNPISLIIPCHRVIRSDGTIGGYLWGGDIKSKLLENEKKHAEK